jgi:hypothetical protein
MRPTCKACDEQRHGDCNGIARYIDQDGYSAYTCECHCRREVNDAREMKIRLDEARRFLRDRGLDSTHEIIEKARTDA